MRLSPRPRKGWIAGLLALCACGGADSTSRPDGGGGVEDPDAGTIPVPLGVEPIAGAPTAALSAVFVGDDDRVWVARSEGVSVLDGDTWSDASTGLTGAVASFHGTPSGELFASGRIAWRLEDGSWVARIEPDSCVSPLRLTSLEDGGLFGVCAYYPYYAAWPSREPADIDIAPLLAGVVGDTAALGNELYVVPGPDYPDAFLMRHNGGELGADEAWDDVALPSGAGGRNLIDIFSPGPDRMVVVGTAGLILSFDSGEWAVEESGVEDDLVAVWGTAADGLYAVGASGQILFRNESAWTLVPSGTSERLVGVHGRSGGRVVIVGAEGSVLEVVR